MSATLKLYIDWFNKRMIASAVSGSTFTLSPFTQGNILPVQVQIVEPDPAGNANSYVKPDISNMALEAVMTAPPVGNAADTPFMTQYSWVKDTTNKIFTANFDFTAAAVDTYIGGSRTKQAFLEFVVLEDSSRYSIWANTVDINATAIKNTSVVAVAGQVALTLQDAQQRFIPFLAGAGQTLTLKSPNGLRQRILGVNDDGTAVDDLI